jgi:resuscitation-promoting factor RpfB
MALAGSAGPSVVPHAADAVAGQRSQASLPAVASPAGPARPASLGAAGAPGGIVLLAYARAGMPTVARGIARAMLPHFHWSVRKQFRYLNWLWQRESSWNKYASNPYSGAYGIPQALPGSKMASAGPHWRTDAHTQIRWGLRYIRARYGSPRRAWNHSRAYGWY